MERVWRRVAATLGLMLGVGPALLANLFPQLTGISQLGVTVLGAILGVRSPVAGDRPLDTADAAEIGGEERVR
jgi:hypothetical protein